MEIPGTEQSDVLVAADLPATPTRDPADCDQLSSGLYLSRSKPQLEAKQFCLRSRVDRSTPIRRGRAKTATLPHRNTALQQEGTDLIDDAGSLADQPLPHPVQDLTAQTNLILRART
jgi:hypothetical protein